MLWFVPGLLRRPCPCALGLHSSLLTLPILLSLLSVTAWLYAGWLGAGLLDLGGEQGNPRAFYKGNLLHLSKTFHIRWAPGSKNQGSGHFSPYPGQETEAQSCGLLSFSLIPLTLAPGRWWAQGKLPLILLARLTRTGRPPGCFLRLQDF